MLNVVTWIADLAGTGQIGAVGRRLVALLRFKVQKRAGGINAPARLRQTSVCTRRKRLTASARNRILGVYSSGRASSTTTSQGGDMDDRAHIAPDPVFGWVD